MMEPKKTNGVFRLFAVILLITMILSSCSPKAPHLTQNLENSKVPGQAGTQTPEKGSETPGSGTPQVQSPSPVYEPSGTSTQPVATQVPSATLIPVQTRTVSPTGRASTATPKSNTPQPATQTPSPLVSPTKTSTITKTLTPRANATLTPSPTMQTGWEGEWTAYVVQSDGSVLSGILTLTLAGEAVNGEFDAQGSLMSLDGNLQFAGDLVSGNYSGFSGNGFFKWIFRESGTFAGNLDNKWAFCGARPGLPQPDPCGYFDPE